LAQFQASINHPHVGSVRQLVGDRGVLLIRDVRSLRQDLPDVIRLGRYTLPMTQALTEMPGEHEQPHIHWQTLRPRMGVKHMLRGLPGYRLLASLVHSQRRAARRPVVFDSFVSAILDGGEPLVSGADALLTVELINAIIISAVRGATVDLPLDRDACDAVFDALSRGDLSIPRWR
jgi:predicted dehydrogenase